MGVGLILLVFGVTLFIEIPIGVAIGITCLAAPFLAPNLGIDAQYIYRCFISTIDSYPILAGPLFVLSGNIMAQGGISKRLFDFFAFFVGNRTGGLLIAVVFTCLFYGAISGAAPATTAAVGAMTIPLLIDLGYDKTFVTAVVSVSGALGVIIPPSIPFIMYGLVSNESVGSLFIAGVLPGIVVGLLLMLYCWWYCKIRGEDKEKLMRNYNALRSKSFLKMFRESFWALLSPIFILGGIYGGVVTPTEAADISVIYALAISLFVYKTIRVRDIPKMFFETFKIVGATMIIVSAASVFGRVLTIADAPQFVSSVIGSVFDNKIYLLLAVNILLIVVGMLMETLTAILILTPLLLPLAKLFGVDPIHFGVIMVVNLAIGYSTPPVGMNLFVASGITGIPVIDIAKKAIPLILVFILAQLIITFVPWLSLALL